MKFFSPAAKDLHEDIFISSGTLHGLVELFGAILVRGHHQTDDYVFKVAAQFALEVLDEILIM